LSATRDTECTDALLGRRVRIPEEVVYRSFVQETVILNLERGRYHGVNPVGGRMLDTLCEVSAVADAATILARDFDRPLEEIERDLCEFCDGLIERGLLTVDES
jgi:Coenzyme PQQ synthesis protein D (PqqD)